MTFRLWNGLLCGFYWVLMYCNVTFYAASILLRNSNDVFATLKRLLHLEETTELCIVSFSLLLHCSFISSCKKKKKPCSWNIKYSWSWSVLSQYCLINLCFTCVIDLHVHANVQVCFLCVVKCVLLLLAFKKKRLLYWNKCSVFLSVKKRFTVNISI